MKMNPIYIFLMLVLSNGCIISSFAANHNKLPLFISCGLSKSSTPATSDGGNRTWISDEGSSFAPADINTVSTVVTTTDTVNLQSLQDDDPRFKTARVFNSTLTYTFSLTPGPIFLRLYFTTLTNYNNIPFQEFFVSLKANQHTLLQNFSSFFNSPNNTFHMMREFHFTVQNHLTLTFSPGNDNSNSSSSSSSSYGFINAIEIVGVPEGLYINSSESTPPYICVPDSGIGCTTKNTTTALQTYYRLNVGGYKVSPNEDSGDMWRTWDYDSDYLAGSFKGTEGGGPQYQTQSQVNFTKIPAYVAPEIVYTTERIIGDHAPEVNMKCNLTWKFMVDPGFDYLMRLHFCEMFLDITGSTDRLFDVYVNGMMAKEQVDVWTLSGGLGVPMYQDYYINRVGDFDTGNGNGNGNGTKVYLWLTLHPDRGIKIADVLLNGLEILKFSKNFNGSDSYLAAPNPSQGPLVPSPPTTLPGKGSNHRFLSIICGAIGGAILVSLSLFVCLIVYKRRENKKKNMDTNTESKDKWAPLSFDLGSTTTTSTVSSSLPSDLCRHFTFTQIRVATRDFDEDLVIGRGGFGKVYKGSIDGGATKVAIKRLNSTSKQGVREFQTEIEMLSRLRHVHLVSLIGYCEDEGEMILIYEYMPRGTLRDHLLYKIPENFDKSTNIFPLSWKQRLMICLGSARGLHYLHAGAKQLIIHRDVKSTNILLDDKWTAKVSDFGLSKVGPDHSNQSGSTHVSTAVKGSAGYLDPEYYRRNQLTEKSDVYSFGVVLFEVLCARAAIDPKLSKEQANLAMWARSRYKKGILHTIVDPNLTGQIAPESLRKFGEIADLCVRDRGTERPSMGDVVWGLEFALQLQETAENDNIANGTPDESFDLSSNYLSAVDVGFTDNDASTNSIDIFSQSTAIEGSPKKIIDSKSTTSSSDYYLVDTKSGSVFSEIDNPKAR